MFGAKKIGRANVLNSVMARQSACIAAMLLCFAAPTSAATLDVDIVVTHGVYSGSGERVTSRSVVYLVLDRSGSMAEKTLKGGRSPDEALLESLKMQLDAIQLGKALRVLPF